MVYFFSMMGFTAFLAGLGVWAAENNLRDTAISCTIGAFGTGTAMIALTFSTH